jgi:hypothetical protein
MAMIEVLEPAGQVQKPARLQCNPVQDLSGRRLAILDNGKPNFQRLALLVAEQLRAERGLASVTRYRKENPAVGAGAELLERIAKESDLVLAGSAD